jgi:hypothetical protein
MKNVLKLVLICIFITVGLMGCKQENPVSPGIQNESLQHSLSLSTDDPTGVSGVTVINRTGGGAVNNVWVFATYGNSQVKSLTATNSAGYAAFPYDIPGNASYSVKGNGLYANWIVVSPPNSVPVDINGSNIIIYVQLASAQ